MATSQVKDAELPSSSTTATTEAGKETELTPSSSSSSSTSNTTTSIVSQIALRESKLSAEKKAEYERIMGKINRLDLCNGDAEKVTYDEVYQFLLTWSGDMGTEEEQKSWTELQLPKLNRGDTDYLYK